MLQAPQTQATPSSSRPRRFTFSSLLMSLGSLIAVVGLFYPWVTLTTTACALLIFCSSQSQQLSLVQLTGSSNQLPGIPGLDNVQNTLGQAETLIILIVGMGITLLIYTMCKATAAARGRRMGGGGRFWRITSLLLALFLLLQVGYQAFNSSPSIDLSQPATYFSSGVAMTFAGIVLIVFGFALELFAL